MNWYGQVYAITEPVIRDILVDSHAMDIDSRSGGLSSKEGYVTSARGPSTVEEGGR